MMVMIAWNLLGFLLFDSLPKGHTFGTEYYRDNILSALLPLHPQADGRKLMTHADDAGPHKSRKCTTFYAENDLRLTLYPPNSPDLAPSDFFVFGHVKHRLQGTTFRSREELLEVISEIVTAIPPDILHGVFEHWMERLEWVSQNNGDYHP
jgi:transposase